MLGEKLHKINLLVSDEQIKKLKVATVEAGEPAKSWRNMAQIKLNVAIEGRINISFVKLTDNGDEFMDRYTAYFNAEQNGEKAMYLLTMSHYAISPQGVCMSDSDGVAEIMANDNGVLVHRSEAPEQVQEAIRRFIEE